jgi:hypothetical protein
MDFAAVRLIGLDIWYTTESQECLLDWLADPQALRSSLQIRRPSDGVVTRTIALSCVQVSPQSLWKDAVLSAYVCPPKNHAGYVRWLAIVDIVTDALPVLLSQ